MADLTTLANVKQWLAIPVDTVVNDPLLTRLVSAASEHVLRWLNRDILEDQYVEDLDGHGSPKMVLDNYPITAVSVVRVGTHAYEPSVNGSFGYVFNAHRITLIQGVFPRGLQNVHLEYTAGYPAVPADIEQATIELVGLRYKELDRIGIVSKGLAGETISFTQRDFTQSIKSTLQQYRRVV